MAMQNPLRKGEHSNRTKNKTKMWCVIELENGKCLLAERPPRETVPHVSELIPIIIPILKEHHVIKASIVGSYARNKQTIESDIDILCTFDESKNIHMMKLAELTVDLEDGLNITVDIVDDRGLTHPGIRKSMLKDAIPLELFDQQADAPE